MSALKIGKRLLALLLAVWMCLTAAWPGGMPAAAYAEGEATAEMYPAYAVQSLENLTPDAADDLRVKLEGRLPVGAQVRFEKTGFNALRGSETPLYVFAVRVFDAQGGQAAPAPGETVRVTLSGGAIVQALQSGQALRVLVLEEGRRESEALEAAAEITGKNELAFEVPSFGCWVMCLAAEEPADGGEEPDIAAPEEAGEPEEAEEPANSGDTDGQAAEEEEPAEPDSLFNGEEGRNDEAAEEAEITEEGEEAEEAVSAEGREEAGEVMEPAEPDQPEETEVSEKSEDTGSEGTAGEAPAEPGLFVLFDDDEEEPADRTGEDEEAGEPEETGEPVEAGEPEAVEEPDAAETVLIEEQELPVEQDGFTLTFSGLLPANATVAMKAAAEAPPALVEQPASGARRASVKKSPGRTAPAAVASAAVGAEETLFAYDITILDENGQAWEPEEAITVTLRSAQVAQAAAAGKTLTVQHTFDDGALEELIPAVAGESLAFEAASFSEYAVKAAFDVGERSFAAEAGELAVELSGQLPRSAAAQVAGALPELDGRDILCAADIALYNYDAPIQPQWGAVEVVFRSGAIATALEAGMPLELWHVYVDEAGERQLSQVADFTAEGDTVSFQAESFSVFAIAATTLTETVAASDGNTYEIEVTYENTSGIPMEGTALLVSELKPGDTGYEEYLAASAAKLGAGLDNIEISRVFDIRIVDENDYGIVYEPTGDVAVSIRLVGETLDGYANLDVLHFVEDEDTDSFTVYDMDRIVDGETVRFTTDSFSVYVVTGYVLETTIEIDGQTYKVTATYDDHAGIPGDARLNVSEMDVLDDAYVQYMKDTAEALGVSAGELGYLRMLDIAIEGNDGTKYKPNDQVKITVELMDEAETGDLRVVHFGEETEELTASTEGDTVSFTTDSFSLFSFVDLTLIQNVVDAVFGSTYRDKLYENDDIIVSGRMPRTAIVEVNPAGVEIDGADVLAAYDIKIYAGQITKALGLAWQPTDGALTVRMKSDALDGREDVAVYHYADGSTTPELVTEAEVNDNSVEFQADSFSVYALGGQYLRTYRFFTYDANMAYVEYMLYTDAGTTTFTQVIKSAGEGLVVPQLPSIPGSAASTFSGWYVGTGVTNSGDVYTYSSISEEPFDFDSISEVTETETVYLFARFADYAYVVFHDQYNGSSNNGNGGFPVAMTRRGEKISGTAAVQISDFSVAYDDDSSNENAAPSMAFYGWSYTPVTTAGSDTDDEGSAVSKIATDSISITKNTDLYPIFRPIHWLNYYSGSTGSGATYIPSTYYYVGEGPASVSVPVRSGYTFDGWYTGSVSTTDNGDGTTTETVTYGVKVANSDGSLVDGASDPANGVSVSGGQLLLTKNATIYAKWNIAGTKYAVVFWRQNIDDDKNAADAEKTYDFAESVVLDAQTGDSVNVPASVAGYDLKATAGTYYDEKYYGFHYSRCDDATTVNGDGSTVLNVYYDRDLISFNFVVRSFSQNNSGNYYYGNGNAYLLRKSGNTDYLLLYLNNNTIYGYATERTVLYSDQNGTEAETINYGTTYYAKYHTSADAYTYVQLTWIATNRISGLNGYNRSNYSDNTETYSGLYGQPLSKYNYSWPTAYSWLSEKNDSLNMRYLATVMYEFSYNMTAVRYSTDGALSNAVRIQYYFQNTDGSEPDFNGATNSYVEYGSGTSVPPGIFYGLFTGMTPARYKQGDGDWVTITTNAERFSLSEITRVYFTRSPQTITFVDSRKTTTEFGTKTALYGATTDPIADPESPYPGYSFTGWYYDPDCTTKVDFTKPIDADLIVYAGWETIWYKIIIDPNFGALNGSGSTWFWEPYNGDPIEEYTWATRDYVESPSGTYFYHYDDRSAHGWPEEWTRAEDDDKQRDAYYTTNQGDATDHIRTFKYAENAYRYAGWYEVDQETGEETLYNFGEPVTHDTYLILHWKKIGTYHVQYNPVVTQDGETVTGTIDNADSNETLFFELDGDDYADNAEVVVSRVAKAPDGYNFIGWRIRGDASERVYEPGQSFVFLSRYAVAMPQGETIFLDAVYTRVKTAKIVYDANGGVIVPGALDYGEPTDTEAPAPTTSYDVAEGTATIENLVNNSEIRLSDGGGFTMENATLVGWSESPAYDPSTDTLFELNTNYYVDTEDPVKLYAVWEVKVYFDKNKVDASWGGDWEADGFAFDAEKGSYYKTIYLNNPISQPANIPTSSDEDMFLYWSKTRYTDSSTVALPYDFGETVTGELTLYGFWGKIQIPLHAVDSSAETLANRDDAWLTQAYIRLGGTQTNVPLGSIADASTYTKVDTTRYAYFAAVSDSMENISEANIITAVGYNASTHTATVTYQNGTTTDLPSGYEVYLVYWLDPLSLDIGYKVMNTSGALSDASGLQSTRPQTATAGSYNMQAALTTPRAYASNNYSYYSYAIGTPGANSASQLRLITTSSNSDSGRPQLQIKNTWRGYQYSTDGGSAWVSCGHDGSVQLYVVYFETDSQPTVVTIKEKTIGTQADMDEEFEYVVVITETKIITTTSQRQRRYYSYSSGYYWQDNGTPSVTTNTTGPTEIFNNTSTPYEISNDELQTITVFYITDADKEIGSEYSSGGITYRNSITTTTITTQTVTITQQPKSGFSTSNTSTAGTSTQPYAWTYTTTSTAATPTVTYTNVHTPLTVEVHVALVGGSGITLDDDERAPDHTVTLDIDRPEDAANSRTFLTEIPAADLFTGDDTIYGFAGIVYGVSGTTQGDIVTVAGTDVNSVVYKQMYPSDTARDNIYELTLLDSASTTLDQLGSYKVYYLYYPLPKVQYVKEGEGGTLTPIVATGENPLNSGSTITLNGVTVTQNQMLPVTTSLFTVTQNTAGTAANNYFNMPLVLDDTTVTPAVQNYLRYTKLGVGSANAASTSQLSITDTLTMQLKVDGGQVKWSLDGATWNTFAGAPAIYAIYSEIGYDLRITKAVAGDASGVSKAFTLTLSSTAITKSSYAVTGTGYPTVTATLASGSTPGTISLVIQDGSDITISGLGRGGYTITESDNSDYTLTASREGSAVTVVGNQYINNVALDGNKALALTNTRKTQTVTITKTLTDPVVNAATFSFSGTLTDGSTDITSDIAGLDSFTITANTPVAGQPNTYIGTAVFTLPVGAVLTVEETMTEAQSELYEGTVTPAAGSLTVSEAAADNALNFTNTRKSARLTITKNVTGDMGDRSSTNQFTFTLVSVAEETSGTIYAWTKTAVGGTASSGTLTTVPGSNTFTLAHGESIVIELPLNKTVVIREANGLYTPNWSTSDSTVTLTGGSTASVTATLTSDAHVIITNDLPAVAPTGVSFHTLPLLFIFAAGALLAGVAVLHPRRKREPWDGEE